MPLLPPFFMLQFVTSTVNQMNIILRKVKNAFFKKRKKKKKLTVADTKVHHLICFGTIQWKEEKGKERKQIAYTLWKLFQQNCIPGSHRKQDLIFASPEYPRQTFLWRNTLQYIAWLQPQETMSQCNSVIGIFW